MKFIFNLLKPAPHIQEIEDANEVEQKYQYWRIRIWYSMFVGYALYYFTRKSFTFAAPGLMRELGFTYEQLGILGSILSISYGVSKFASGMLSDRSNPRYFMAFGLMMTGILNIFFGMSSSLYFFAFFWGLNGWFQGFGWPPCARFLTHWYSHSERGSWWSSWNVSHNIGAFLIPLIAGLCLNYLGWRSAMYIPGVICLFGGLFLINRLRDTPQSLGLPSIEKFRNDYPPNYCEKEQEKEHTSQEILFDFVLKNKYIWMLAIAYFFLYVVRTGINDWTALFLLKEKGYVSSMAANSCISMFEVGGFFGSLCAGWASDLIGAKRGPVNILFTVGIICSVLIFWFLPANHQFLDATAIFLLGFFIFGPQMLIGVSVAELAHKKAAATSTGFAGCFAYFGAAVAGWPIGKITTVYGWNGFFWVMLVCGLLSLLFLLPLWTITDQVQAKNLKLKNA